MSLKTSLKLTTSLSIIRQGQLIAPIITRDVAPPASSPRPSSRKVERRSGGAAIGMRMGNSDPIPEVNEASLAKFEEDSPRFLTRHITERRYQTAIEGSLWLSPIVNYKATEENYAHRFSDVTESTIHEYFTNEDGVYNSLALGNFVVSNSVLGSGGDTHILIEHHTNDLCACFSIGPYDIGRALNYAKKQAGDTEPTTHYVVYDFLKLRAAISEIVAEKTGIDHGVFGHSVNYRHKDVEHRVGRNHNGQIIRDAQLWFENTFTKPELFAHEDEYRIVAYQKGNAGGLGVEYRSALPLDDERISDCIVEHGMIKAG